MKSYTELAVSLLNFTGTEAYHKVSIFPILLTDGAHYLAENAECYWLMDLIGAHLMEEGVTDNSMFTVIRVHKDPETGEVDILFDDGNGNIWSKQHIEVTDFPLITQKLYAQPHPHNGRQHWVIMLPSEY